MTLRDAAKMLRSHIRTTDPKPLDDPAFLHLEVLALVCERLADIAPAADRPLED